MTARRRQPGPQRLRVIFAAPIAIGIVSLVGLVSALTGDGLRDAISWAALGVPVAVFIWAMSARRF
jgi:hypothetical protein